MDSEDRKGLATAGAGAGVLSLPHYGRKVEGRIRQVRHHGAERLRQEASGVESQMRQAKTARRANINNRSRVGGNVSGESAAKKAAHINRMKRMAGQANTMRMMANKIDTKPMRFNSSPKQWSAAVALGAPMMYLGGRKTVEKADKRKRQFTRGDYDAGAAGTVLGAGGVHAASQGLKIYEQGPKGPEERIRQDPHHSATLKEHRAKLAESGVLPKNAGGGHPGWVKYSRTYPKSLPGATMRRTIGYLGAGKTGVAVTGAMGAAGAVAGVKAKRRMQDRVSKRKYISPTEMKARRRGSALAGNAIAAGSLGSTAALAGALAMPRLARAGKLTRLGIKTGEQGEKVAGKIKNATLYSGIGLGGAGSAKAIHDNSLTRYENRVKKDELGEIFTKSWTPVTPTADPETKRHRRAQQYQNAATGVAAGATGAAGYHGAKAGSLAVEGRRFKTATARAKRFKPAAKNAKIMGIEAGGAALAGGGAALIHRKRQGSWQTYGKSADFL